MQSTNLEEIKAALWEQASHLCTRVSWGTPQVIGEIQQGATAGPAARDFTLVSSGSRDYRKTAGVSNWCLRPRRSELNARLRRISSGPKCRSQPCLENARSP